VFRDQVSDERRSGPREDECLADEYEIIVDALFEERWDRRRSDHVVRGVKRRGDYVHGFYDLSGACDLKAQFFRSGVNG